MLRSTDVCLVPRYIKDQGGYWPLEAMARGVAVIASDMPAFRDFVVPGKTGLLADPYSPPDLAAKIQLLLDDTQLLGAMKTGACRFVRDYHALDVVGPKYAAFYDRIVAR